MMNMISPLRTHSNTTYSNNVAMYQCIRKALSFVVLGGNQMGLPNLVLLHQETISS